MEVYLDEDQKMNGLSSSLQAIADSFKVKIVWSPSKCPLYMEFRKSSLCLERSPFGKTSSHGERSNAGETKNPGG